MGHQKYRLNRPYLSSSELASVQKVLESGWLAESAVTTQFEEHVAGYVEAKYAVAVCNATVALTLALKALHAKGQVRIPDFTHPATALAAVNAGLQPVLVDVDPETYNQENCDVPVSWGGNPLKWRSRTFKVEDAACSLGSEYNHVRTGSTFTSVFSFHPRKLATCGEGGVVVTNDEALAEKVRTLKNFGKGGGNFRLNNVASAIGLCQLDKLETVIANRVRMAHLYGDLLEGRNAVAPPQQPEHARHTYQTYGVILNRGNRDRIILKLAKQGIETSVGAQALHALPAFRGARRAGKLENSTRLARRMLCLPMDYLMGDGDQQKVVDALLHELA